MERIPEPFHLVYQGDCAIDLRSQPACPRGQSSAKNTSLGSRWRLLRVYETELERH